MDNKLTPIALTVLYVLMLVLCALERQRRKVREHGVYLPESFFWIEAVCGGVFVILGWMGADSGAFVTVVFGSLTMLCLLLMLGWKNCFLIYDQEGFTQRNLIGMQRRFRYDQVAGWWSNPANPIESTVYALGKKVSFNQLSQGGLGFLVALDAGYRRTHGGKNLPSHRQTRHTSGFSAHVHNPGEFLFVFLLLVVFIIGAGGFCVWMAWEPLDGFDCETLSLSFTAWSVEDGTLTLTAKGYGERFEIRGYPEFMSLPEEFSERCDGETVFTAQARRVDPDGGPDYYWVQALSAEGKDYLTFSDSTAQHRADIPMLLGLFGGFLGVILVLAGLMYMVGCDPAKYPKWLVRGLFKEGYIEY